MLFTTSSTLTNAFIFAVALLSLIQVPTANADTWGDIINFAAPRGSDIIYTNKLFKVVWYIEAGNEGILTYIRGDLLLIGQDNEQLVPVTLKSDVVPMDGEADVSIPYDLIYYELEDYREWFIQFKNHSGNWYFNSAIFEVWN